MIQIIVDKPETVISGKELARRWEFLPRLNPEDAERWEQELEALKRSEPQPGTGVWDDGVVIP